MNMTLIFHVISDPVLATSNWSPSICLTNLVSKCCLHHIAVYGVLRAMKQNEIAMRMTVNSRRIMLSSVITLHCLWCLFRTYRVRIIMEFKTVIITKGRKMIQNTKIQSSIKLMSWWLGSVEHTLILYGPTSTEAVMQGLYIQRTTARQTTDVTIFLVECMSQNVFLFNVWQTPMYLSKVKQTMIHEDRNREMYCR